ncbi:MAG: branched-chain amino acid ABC transporter permease [Coriobacteriia bacterium]|nr:branched-chain amino acid ABC transporter permease [Coriobacteriia bacterium]
MQEKTGVWATARRFFGRVPRWAYALAALALAISVPLLEQADLIQTVWLRLGIRSLVYVLLAMGLNVVMGETGLLNLGYIAFFAVGSYTTAIFSSPRLGYHVDFWILLLASTGLAMLAGLLIGLPTLRLRGDYLAIVTLGFGEITRITFNNWESVTNGPGGIPQIYRPMILGLKIDKPGEFYYLVLIFVVLVAIMLTNLKSSRVGRAWNALREDEIAAEHSGIHGTSLKLLSMVISAGIAGLAGCLFAYYQQFINPTYFEFLQSVLVVCMVVLGGMGSIPGAIAGAALLDALPEFIRQAFSRWLPDLLGEQTMDSLPVAVQNFFIEFDRYRMLIVGLVIVVMVIFRPEGILPDSLWRREVREEDPREVEKTRQKLFDFDEGHQDLEA